MALAVNGSGTIFKKCDRSNHRPDSNKGCASSTCQHTCDNPERCQHAWTLRSLMPGARWRRDGPESALAGLFSEAPGSTNLLPELLSFAIGGLCLIARGSRPHA
jgi:hypothetical protein